MNRLQQRLSKIESHCGMHEEPLTVIIMDHTDKLPAIEKMCRIKAVNLKNGIGVKFKTASMTASEAV